MPRWPWIERRFTFDFPPAKFPELLERWRGTPARLEERLAGTSDAVARRSDGGWSIKQNVGHLTDLEPLWTQRLAEILAGARELRAADMTNRATHEAGHNDRPLADLLGDFRRARMAGIAQAVAIKEADWGRAALHPRLKQPMRIADILCFMCEHDDYHLGRIAELLQMF